MKPMKLMTATLALGLLLGMTEDLRADLAGDANRDLLSLVRKDMILGTWVLREWTELDPRDDKQTREHRLLLILSQDQSGQIVETMKERNKEQRTLHAEFKWTLDDLMVAMLDPTLASLRVRLEREESFKQRDGSIRRSPVACSLEIQYRFDGLETKHTDLDDFLTVDLRRAEDLEGAPAFFSQALDGSRKIPSTVDYAKRLTELLAMRRVFWLGEFVKSPKYGERCRGSYASGEEQEHGPGQPWSTLSLSIGERGIAKLSRVNFQPESYGSKIGKTVTRTLEGQLQSVEQSTSPEDLHGFVHMGGTMVRPSNAPLCLTFVDEKSDTRLLVVCHQSEDRMQRYCKIQVSTKDSQNSFPPFDDTWYRKGPAGPAKDEPLILDWDVTKLSRSSRHSLLPTK